MKSILKKIVEAALVALIPVVIEVIKDALEGFKKKIEDGAETT